jgi:hypothetical protein
MYLQRPYSHPSGQRQWPVPDAARWYSVAGQHVVELVGRTASCGREISPTPDGSSSGGSAQVATRFSQVASTGGDHRGGQPTASKTAIGSR